MIWVSPRLALVEALPEAAQQQVRKGQILAQAALKLLVPLARQSLLPAPEMASMDGPFLPSGAMSSAASRIWPGFCSILRATASPVEILSAWVADQLLERLPKKSRKILT